MVLPGPDQRLQARRVATLSRGRPQLQRHEAHVEVRVDLVPAGLSDQQPRPTRCPVTSAVPARRARGQSDRVALTSARCAQARSAVRGLRPPFQLRLAPLRSARVRPRTTAAWRS